MTARPHFFVMGMTGGVLAVALMAPVYGQPAKQKVLREKLELRLQEIARGVDGVMGYSVLDLTSGERLGWLENEVFPTASTIKLTILYELFKQAEEGRIQLDQPQPLDPANRVAGSGVLIELTGPVLSLRDLAILMVVLSDNTATNELIRGLGMDAVNKRMTTLGLKQTRLRRRMIDLAAARRGEENVSTPAELVRLLEAIQKGQGLTPESRNALFEILQKEKSSALRRSVPREVKVASKPGSLEGVRVDAGIVSVERRPYAFAAMTTYLRDEEEGEKAIEVASKAAYDYFSRLAAGAEYGRQIHRN